MNKQQLITQLQSHGLHLINAQQVAAGRKGGAGPSDHRAITIDGTTVMVPIYNSLASVSPFTVEINSAQENLQLKLEGKTVSKIDFPVAPKFYSLHTEEGIPYWKIALLHAKDVLATTVLQNCSRYGDRATSCQFCAIGESLANGKTIARKTPAQLAQVAKAAVELDNVQQMVMTTGTPNTSDRGADYLSQCAQSIKDAVDLPLQAQCEPPDDFIWFERMRQSGIDSLGMHLEAIDPIVRAKIMPGKASVSIEYYFEAFAAAVEIFGRAQVSTYILAGLGDSIETILSTCERLINLGVYPFVVPFVPITGTPLNNHPAPSSEMMFTLYQEIAILLKDGNLSSSQMKAGCGKCGACSGLSSFEK